MNKKQASVATIFGVSSVLFGIHVGGGFATGNQTVSFFVRYGWVAVFLPIIAMFILNWVFREGLIFAQTNKSANYREFCDAIFHPFEKIFSNVYEICYIIILIMAVAASCAGGAALLVTYGVPYIVGVLIIGTLFFLLTIFGKELLAKAASAMTIAIVVSLLVIVFFGLTHKNADLATAAATTNAPLGIGPAVWKMLQYAGYQAFTVATISPYAMSLKNKSGVNKTVAVNFVINTGMLVLTAIMLLAWQPILSGLDAKEATLPTLYIITQTGQSWLRYLYSLALLLAFISTGVGCIFGIVARFETKILLKQNITVRRSVASLVGIVVSMAVSLLGLTTIVAKGYAYMGIIGVFLVILPTLTVVLYRNIKGKVIKLGTAKEEAE